MNDKYRNCKIGFRTPCAAIKSLAAAIIVFNLVAIVHADDSVGAKTDYLEVAAAVNETMRAYHYNPAELDTPEYRRIETAVTELAEVATSDEAFVKGFREIWENGPFSHVEIKVARQSAGDLADYLDNMRIGGGGAILAWQNDVAILTVNTMMGLDTIEEIDAAYAEIAERETSALIIDLRENGGPRMHHRHQCHSGKVTFFFF